MTALGGVSLSISGGEVVALIGENGAGKSTLMKVLGGLVRPDDGEILADGTVVKIDSVKHATELGIGFIHQELNPLDNLDVAGNVYLGREPSHWGLMDRKKMRADTEALLQRIGLPISVDTPLANLSLAHRQMVEIAKALSLNAKVLIMDEPTSSLTLTETERLLQLVKELRAADVGIIYISHRLAEVREIADRVVALKDGQNAGGLTREEISHERMVRLMVGRDLERTARGETRMDKNLRLRVDRLRTFRYPNQEVTFDVRAGEVFGLAGLVGAGRSEVVQCIFGTDPSLGGAVTVDGGLVPPGSPKAAIAAGIGLVPEDRRSVGIIVEWSIKDNITLPQLGKFVKNGLIDRTQETEAAKTQSLSLGVKAPSINVITSNLSGGNQQKVVVGKWLLGKPKVLILDEPTRGVDVGAKAEIYDIMRKLTSEGVAILMVSSDMEEVLAISNRIGVMHEGSLTGILDHSQFSEEAIMELAVGHPVTGKTK